MPAPPTQARLSACAEVVANAGKIPGSFLASGSGGSGVSASSYGAVGDGTADDSTAINAALAACPRGSFVVLDAKPYRCASPINLPNQVSLIGQWQGMVTGSSQEQMTLAQRKVTGTVIQCDWVVSSPSDTSTAFLTLGSDSTLAGLQVYDLRQGTTGAGIVARPWMIGQKDSDSNGQSGASSVTIRHVNLYNPYRGIRIWGCQRFRIESTILSPLKIGVWIDQITDTSTIHNCHVVPIGWFSDVVVYPSDISAYIEANLIAYRFDRCDSMLMSDSMVYDCQTGVYCGLSAIGTNPREPWLRMTNVDLDICDIGIDFQAGQKQSCFYTSGSITTNPSGSNQIAIRTGASAGNLGVANVDLCAQSGHEVRMAGGNLSFVGCFFNSFNNATSGSSPSIVATGGNLTLAGCTFQDARPPISWQQAGGVCRTAATANLGGQANIDPNSRINAGGNA